MPLYFAYGSCMSEKDLRRTEPHAELISAGRVYGKRLAFTRYSAGRKGGVADIVDSSNPYDFVEGYIYWVPNFRTLDRREGHPHVYRREPILVQVVGAKEFLSCDTYLMVDKHMPEYKPSKGYVELILDGAAGLSDEYQEQLGFIINGIPRKQYRAPRKRMPPRSYSHLDFDPDRELSKRLGVD